MGSSKRGKIDSTNQHREPGSLSYLLHERIKLEGLSGHGDGAHLHDAVTDVQMGRWEYKEMFQGSVLLLLFFFFLVQKFTKEQKKSW